MSQVSTTSDVPIEWQLRLLLHGLDAMHAWRGWAWEEETDAFEVIAGAVLVQRTSWTNVEQALANLRAAEALSPEAMARLDDEALHELVRPAGPASRKVRTLKALLELAPTREALDALLRRDAADLRETLLALPGIGEETADAILLYAARRPAFIVDAYTRRVFARVGLGPPEDAPIEEWKAFIAEYIEPDADLYAHLHALFVHHAKTLCTKRAPQCNRCVLQQRCEAAPEHLARIRARAREMEA